MINEDECFMCGSVQYRTVFPYQDVETNICCPCEEELARDNAVTIYKKCTIEIAHMLPGHPTCGNVHGHSVDIVVGVRGRISLKTGMVMDFKYLKKIIQKEVIDRFDHSFLNDTFPVPTAEILSVYIYKKLLSRNIDVTLVRVHETKNNYVEYRGIDDDSGDF